MIWSDHKQFEWAAKMADMALIQAAECSRLRDWLIFQVLRMLEQYGTHSNMAEAILQAIGDDLIGAFEGLIDQDDAAFFKSHVYKSGPHCSDLPYQADDPEWSNS
jgi:hypothetical protein